MKTPLVLTLALSLLLAPLHAHAGAERTNWHFIPRERAGLPIKEMTQQQRLLAHALLATGLSQRG